MSELRYLTQTEVLARWEEIDARLRAAFDQSLEKLLPVDVFGKVDFFEVVEDGESLLLFTAEVIHYPRKSIVLVSALAGKQLWKLKRHLEQFELWCATKGATAYMTQALDPRIVKMHTRYFGMRPTYTTSWKEITHGREE